MTKKKDKEPKPKKAEDKREEVQPTEEEVREFMRWFRKTY